MNIQDELKNDRLAVDFERCRVFIRQDLYGEMLDTSMFSHALRVIKMSWWKKLWICLCMKCFPKRCEQYVREGQFLYHLTRLSDYINEGKTGEHQGTMDFYIVDAEAKPLYVGIFTKNKNEDVPSLGKFYIRQYMGSGVVDEEGGV